ncbi:MAG: pyruvate/oxaloacetate carboxyltransferase [Thermodesulfovibrionales bacterium]|nr:pyruvate/oxaloacetate carboxyltransferase [Thermodesulfovibrionales bacterium]
MKNQKKIAKPLKITDTTFRDGHQSLLATRLRTEDMLPILEVVDSVGYHSIEIWGGATFDVMKRYLNEDPWDRLKKVKKALPNTPLQMLLRGQNLVGYRHYADDVVREFVLYAAECGMDIFRVFDALNDERNFESSFKAIQEAGKHIQATICYTLTERRLGGPVFNIEYFVNKAKKMESMGAHSLCVKDMGGLISPYDAYDLIKALKKELKIPVQLHTHYTSGMGSMSYLMAVEAGVDVIDTAIAPLALRSSQPALEPIVVALEGTERDTGLDINKLFKIGEYLESILPKYRHFLDTSKMAVIDTGVLIHQIPGGMISNLVNQLREANALHRLKEVFEELPRTRKELGYPPLVTPTSQMVGVQSVFNVLMGRYNMITAEVKDYCYGLYGTPPQPIDPEVQKKALKGYPRGETPITCRPADILEPEMEKAREATKGIAKDIGDVLIYALYPQTGMRFLRWKYGLEEPPPEVKPKTMEDVKREEELIKKALAGELVEKTKKTVPPKGPGIKTYNVFVDGEYYSVEIEDATGVMAITKPTVAAVAQTTVQPMAPPAPPPKIEPKPAPQPPKAVEKVLDGKGSVTAPMPGLIIDVKINEGDTVKEGDEVIILEAMKMQNPLKAPVSGVVKAIKVKSGDSVKQGDILVIIG